MRRLFILCLSVFLIFGCENEKSKNDSETRDKKPLVHIETEKGNITLELWPDIAPNHVANFLDLVNTGYYSDLLWHRAVRNFVIQSGSPTNDITGHGGYVIEAEFSNLPHNPGTLSMARGHDPNSASCQFFICLSRRPELDGQYTVFGRTVDGMDAVKKIGALETDKNQKPLEDVHILKIWQEGKAPVPAKSDYNIEGE